MLQISRPSLLKELGTVKYQISPIRELDPCTLFGLRSSKHLARYLHKHYSMERLTEYQRQPGVCEIGSFLPRTKLKHSYI